MFPIGRIEFVFRIPCTPSKRTRREQKCAKDQNQPCLMWENEHVSYSDVTEPLKNSISSRQFMEYGGSRHKK
jgi:hypothetical protein